MPEPKRRTSEAAITLPFAAPPAPGKVIEVAPGILWARLPLPFRLNHVNVWLLEEADGWTVIDSGLQTADGKQVWEELLSGALAQKPLKRFIATHGHIDHIGLAGWLCARFDLPFVGTLTEWYAARSWRARTMAPQPAQADAFLSAHGCEAALVAAFATNRFQVPGNVHPLPDQLVRIRGGSVLRIGDRDWQLITAGGHADEHLSLYCAADRLLIAGDQILQRISPVVGVWWSQPLADPLADYLASLEWFRSLSDDALVLPSHGVPFHGLHRRLSELAAHHAARLGEIERAFDRPFTGREAASLLFPEAIEGENGGLALAETLAHVHHLVTLGRLRRHQQQDRITFHRTG